MPSTFFDTEISRASITKVVEVLESGWISEGVVTKEFEALLEEQCGLSNPVALNSGTSGLHLALVLAGVKRNDEVIIPAQTFVATGLAVLMQGAIPVFADISPKTGNLCPKSVKSKISNQTKVILPVHWAGYPCELTELQALADEYGLEIIEDAAHAFGAEYKGRPVGSISNFTVFSFQAIKHLTTGDGGALCCPDKLLAQRAKKLRWFGIDRENSSVSYLGERQFNIDEVGFKYHMNDIDAAIGIGNLPQLGDSLVRREENAQYLMERLSGMDGITLLERKEDRKHANWLFTVLAEERNNFVRSMTSQGFKVSVVHQRIDHHTVFGCQENELPGQEYFDAHQISLPIHPKITKTELSLLADRINQGW